MQIDRAADLEEGLEGLSPMTALHRSLTGAVLIIDEQKRNAALNPAAEALLGFQPGQSQSLELLPPPLRHSIEETFAIGKPQELQILLTTPEGGEIPVHLNSSFLRSAPGGQRSVVVVLNDLSPARELDDHMRHLGCLASIGTLSASMAHEIKNALVAIKAFLELLIEQNKDAELAGMVSREMRRIDSIVSQMLRFAGPAKPTFSILHLHDLLDQTLRLIEHQLAGKKIRLKKSFVASSDLVQGDTYQLEQALLNLFFNAIDAMGPNGELTLTTEITTPEAEPSDNPGRIPEAHLQLRIQDSGTGIPPENIPRLFDPFFTTKKKGNGLGLSITRRIIQEHSGAISVKSALNQGTAFTLLLPSAA